MGQYFHYYSIFWQWAEYSWKFRGSIISWTCFGQHSLFHGSGNSGTFSQCWDPWTLTNFEPNQSKQNFFRPTNFRRGLVTFSPEVEKNVCYEVSMDRGSKGFPPRAYNFLTSSFFSSFERKTCEKIYIDYVLEEIWIFRYIFVK